MNAPKVDPSISATIHSATGDLKTHQVPTPAESTQAVVQCNELLVVPERHLAIRPSEAWQTPRRTLHLTLLPMMAQLSSDELGLDIAMPWHPDIASVETVIARARSALDTLRAKYQSYFNDIDADDIPMQLGALKPPKEWGEPSLVVEPSANSAWESVTTSPEIAQLAYEGHALYRELFPRESGMRDVLNLLEPGDRLDIAWQQNGGPWLSHVPWILMYGFHPPENDEPVDAARFFGLRYRISYRAYRMGVRSRAIQTSATRAKLLYWGGQSNDEVWSESRKHAQQLARWGSLILPRTGEGKTEITRFLRDPWPNPVGIIYFYCRGVANFGSDPILRFGSTNHISDLLRLIDMGSKPMPSQPLVFVNACESSVGSPYVPNRLERLFFERDCRAFIGTECKVPITFAANFAAVFFSYLYGDHLPPMAAGEALTQTRKFFWDRYRNIGGLFYSYINDYYIQLASDEEVALLSSAQATT